MPSQVPSACHRLGLWQDMTTDGFLLRVALVALSGVLALTVPNFAFMVSLLGSVTTMLISFILPTLFFVSIHWWELTRMHIFLCACVLAVGGVGMAVGLANALSTVS